MRRAPRLCLSIIAIAASLVAGIGDGAVSAASSPSIAVPAARPSAPRSLVAQPKPASVILTWSAPSSTGGKPVTGYRVQRKTPTGWKTLAASAPATPRTFTATGLTNGTEYSFRVASINADGVGPASATVKATPRPLALAPQSFTASGEDGSALLRWAPPVANGTPAITGYRIQKKAANGSYTTVATVAGSKRSHRVTGLANGTTQTFRINAVNSIGQGAFSAARRATLPLTTSFTAGGNHTCAVMPDTTVTCWGWDKYGQLGDGTVGDGTDESDGNRTSGVTVRGTDGTSPLTGVARVDAGTRGTCAVLHLRRGRVLGSERERPGRRRWRRLGRRGGSRGHRRAARRRGGRPAR